MSRSGWVLMPRQLAACIRAWDDKAEVLSYEQIDDLSRYLLSAAPSPTSTAGEVEEVAKHVYEAMRWALKNPPVTGDGGEWIERGNSFAQDRAREAARALTPTQGRAESEE